MRMNKLKATKLSDNIKTKDTKLLEDVIELAYIEGALNFLDQMAEEQIENPAKIWKALRKRFDILTGV